MTSDLASAQSEMPRSRGRLVLARFAHNKVAAVSAVVLVLLVLAAVLAPLLAPYAYDEIVAAPYLPSGDGHLMGTDSLGRDVWSRILYGARVSLGVGVGSQVIALSIGLVVGGCAGYAGRWVDAALMRLTDVAQALPAILTALLLLTVLGNSTMVLVLAIGLASWPPIARVARAQILQVRQMEYVEAAISLGLPQPRIMLRHVIPNALGPILVQMTFGIALAVFAEAFLAFIGLGPPPPNPSWGRLAADGFAAIGLDPTLVLWPTLAISISLLAINFVGDGLRDAIDVGSDRR